MSRDFVEKLEKLVKKDIDATHRTQTTVKAYDNPNWPYRQAHTHGYLRAMYNIEKFIDQYKQKEKEEKIDRIPDSQPEYIITGPSEPGSNEVVS